MAAAGIMEGMLTLAKALLEVEKERGRKILFFPLLAP